MEASIVMNNGAGSLKPAGHDQYSLEYTSRDGLGLGMGLTARGRARNLAFLSPNK